MNVESRIPLSRPAVFDVARIREDFPILRQKIRGKPLVFLDSAASAQKPRVVIDAMREAMEMQYANVHRGLHWMSERTTDAYEAARDAVAGLLNAPDRHEVVITRNVTESLNLMAHSYGRGVLKPGQAVLISGMEHHSNIVPWQMLRDDRGIELRVAPITDAGELDMSAYEALLADGKVGLVSMTHMSNVLGTYTPAERIVQIAHAHGAKVLFDGAQAVVHRRVDVQALGCDFYAFTGHKLYGPTGIGVLWGRRELLDAMPPFLGGGEMISSVSYERSTWARGAAQVRGWHAADPGRHRPEGGDRLRAVYRLRRDCRARDGAGRPRVGAARCDRGRAYPWPGAGPWRCGFVRVGSRACARRRDVAGSPGHCGARGTSLCRAADAPVRPGQHGARKLCDLYDAGRDRLSG